MVFNVKKKIIVLLILMLTVSSLVGKVFIGEGIHYNAFIDKNMKKDPLNAGHYLGVNLQTYVLDNNAGLWLSYSADWILGGYFLNDPINYSYNHTTNELYYDQEKRKEVNMIMTMEYIMGLAYHHELHKNGFLNIGTGISFGYRLYDKRNTDQWVVFNQFMMGVAVDANYQHIFKDKIYISTGLRYQVTFYNSLNVRQKDKPIYIVPTMRTFNMNIKSYFIVGIPI